LVAVVADHSTSSFIVGLPRQLVCLCDRVNMMGPAPMTQTSVVDGGPYVNGLRLLRLVRLRRELRALWQLAILAVPVWFGLIVWIQASTPDDSDAWNRANADAWPGFVIIGCVFVVGLAGMILLRLAAGVTGRVAAAFVPMASKGNEATVEGDHDALRGLLPRLRKKRFISIGAVLLFLVFVVVGVYAVINLVPVYAANHGSGGTVVTIGKDATISGYTDSRTTGRYGTNHREYFLSTPVGKAIADDREPVAGQQWLVRGNPLGNDEAYLIGGHDYLLVGGLALLAAVVDVFILLGMVASFRREARIRLHSGHVPLAYSVRRLAAGARPVLRFDVVRSVPVGLPPLPQDSDEQAHRLLRARRLHAGIAGVVVLALVVVGVILVSRVDQPAPPTDRDITLPYLSGTSWDTDVEAFYTDTDTVHDLTVSLLQDGGVTGNPTVGPIWSLGVPSSDAAAAASGSGSTDADLDVVGVGSVSPAKALAGAIAQTKVVADKGAPAPATVTGLPSGWVGELTDGKAGGTNRTADVFGCAGGTLVWISVDGTDGDAALSRRVDELATAIAQRTIPRFVTDTAR
jgi:hypothetical protein